jgi:hypothetical protein
MHAGQLEALGEPKGVRRFEQIVELAGDSIHEVSAPDDAVRKRLPQLVERMSETNERRNRVVHDPPFLIHPPVQTQATHRMIPLDIPAPPEDVCESRLCLLVLRLLGNPRYSAWRHDHGATKPDYSRTACAS